MDDRKDKQWSGANWELLTRHMGTLIALGICFALVLCVGQIRYAYAPGGFTATRPMTYLVIGVFLFIFLVSALGIFAGEILYRRRWAAKRVRHDGREKFRLRLRYLPFIGLVTWANGLAHLLERRGVRGVFSVVTLGIGIAAFVWEVPVRELGLNYPLSEYMIKNVVAVPFTLVGFWMFFARPAKWPEPGNVPGYGQVIGWHLGWIASSLVVQEMIWYLATLQLTPSFGYLMYTQWAFWHLLFLMIVGAHLLDYLDAGTRFPVRLVGLALAGWIALVNLDPVEIDVNQPSAVASPVKGIRGDGDEDFLSADDEWVQRFLRRVESVPSGPCILVAASGGGSRASIFTSLVLRGLAHEKSFGDTTFADQVVLISSVSGGGLGATQAIHQGFERSFDSVAASHKNNDLGELTHFTRAAIEREIEKLESMDVRGRTKENDQFEAARMQRFAVAQRLRDSIDDRLGDASWITSDPVVDQMSMDFMAPILRGVVTVGPSRGETLRRFWEQVFEWDKITNTNTYNDLAEPPPLHFLNACVTSWGSRYVLGYPALPKNFFSQTGAQRRMRTRFPIRSLADESTEGGEVVSLPLSHAVRLTSNFPWGFRVRKLGQRNLLDGGMVDNTGIDTIYEVIRRLSESATGRRALAALAQKGVFVLEIDSGGKPSGMSEMKSEAAGIVEPIATFSNVIHTNSDIIKEYYLKEIDAILRQSLISSYRERLGPHEEELMNEIESIVPDVFARVRFQCENFTGSEFESAQEQGSVMTAWALDSRQKGIVMARFLVELEVFKNEITFMRGKLQTAFEQMAMLHKGLNDLAATYEDSWNQDPSYSNSRVDVTPAQDWYRSSLLDMKEEMKMDTIDELKDHLQVKQALNEEFQD